MVEIVFQEKISQKILKICDLNRKIFQYLWRGVEYTKLVEFQVFSLKGLIQNQIFMSSIPPQDITAPKMLNLPSPNKFVHIKNSTNAFTNSVCQ